MPVTHSKSLLRTAKLCGCSIPYELSTMIESYYHYPQAMKEIGINYATHQIIDLITNGVDGIHIYTMNKPEIAKAIFQNHHNIPLNTHYSRHQIQQLYAYQYVHNTSIDDQSLLRAYRQ